MVQVLSVTVVPCYSRILQLVEEELIWNQYVPDGSSCCVKVTKRFYFEKEKTKAVVSMRRRHLIFILYHLKFHFNSVSHRGSSFPFHCEVSHLLTHLLDNAVYLTMWQGRTNEWFDFNVTWLAERWDHFNKEWMSLFLLPWKKSLSCTATKQNQKK